MSSISISYRNTTVRRRRLVRMATVAAAALAVVAVWLVADKAAGIDLRQPAFGSGAPQALSAGFAAAVAALAALAGWGLLVPLERKSDRGASLWLRAALVALLLSLAGPLSGHGVGIGDRVALVCMHLAAALIIIPLLHQSSTAGREPFRHEDRR
jgi:hypothetical protein